LPFSSRPVAAPAWPARRGSKVGGRMSSHHSARFRGPASVDADECVGRSDLFLISAGRIFLLCLILRNAPAGLRSRGSSPLNRGGRPPTPRWRQAGAALAPSSSPVSPPVRGLPPLLLGPIILATLLASLRPCGHWISPTSTRPAQDVVARASDLALVLPAVVPIAGGPAGKRSSRTMLASTGVRLGKLRSQGHREAVLIGFHGGLVALPRAGPLVRAGSCHGVRNPVVGAVRRPSRPGARLRLVVPGSAP